MVLWIQIIIIIINNISFVKIINLRPNDQNLNLKLNTSHLKDIYHNSKPNIFWKGSHHSVISPQIHT
jgi:hypothetical protein